MVVDTGIPSLTSADLAVSQTDSLDPATVGSDVTYTVTVTNAGPATATGITLTDTVPAGVSNIRCTACSTQCSFTSPTLKCSLTDLAAGASTTWRLLITPTRAGTLNNTVRVTSSTTDPNLANNTSTATTTVTGGTSGL